MCILELNISLEEIFLSLKVSLTEQDLFTTSYTAGEAI